MFQARYPSKSWVFLSKLGNTLNNNSILIQNMLNSLRNNKCSFISTTLLVHTTTPTISIKVLSSTSVNFHHFVTPLLFNKTISAINTNTPFLYTAVYFFFPIFAHSYPSNWHQKCFSCLSHWASPSFVKRQRSYGVLWGFLISLFFFKVWTMITGLTITNSLLLRLKKLVCYR